MVHPLTFYVNVVSFVTPVLSYSVHSYTNTYYYTLYIYVGMRHNMLRGQNRNTNMHVHRGIVSERCRDSCFCFHSSVSSALLSGSTLHAIAPHWGALINLNSEHSRKVSIIAFVYCRNFGVTYLFHSNNPVCIHTCLRLLNEEIWIVIICIASAGSTSNRPTAFDSQRGWPS